MIGIEVYFIDVRASSDVIDGLSAKLTGPERTRAQAYRFDHDRRRSIVARAATRQLLGRYLNENPQSLAIEELEHGKPVLRDRQIEFNASHSGDLVALAFSRRSPVGVDVEKERPLRHADALAKRFFSESEAAIVNDARDHAQAFLTIWTAKEAIVKATGTGIGAGDLRDFSVPPAQPSLLPAFAGWFVASIQPPMPCYYAAVACRIDGHSVICRNIETLSLL